MSVSEAKRVALLARPGEARERLRVALHEAGAEIVLEDDPNTLDADALGTSAPQVVLVALEPAIEDSLERFDGVLHDPAVSVIFDEAELAARREAGKPSDGRATWRPSCMGTRTCCRPAARKKSACNWSRACR